MGDNLDKVFVQVYWGYNRDACLEWALDHFDKDKTQLMIFPHYDTYNEECYRIKTKSYYLPRCAEKNFRVEVHDADDVKSDYETNLSKLITTHGINKLVIYSSDTTKNAISKVFNEAPHLYCKIWFIDWVSEKPDSTTHFGPLSKVFVECENLEKMIMNRSTHEKVEKQMLVLKKTVEDEISGRKKVEDELLMLKKAVEDEASRRVKVEEELLSMTLIAKLNEQENDQLKHINALSMTFSFQELEQATQNFNDSLKIGEGEKGHVYKGTFRGTTVAIKKFKPESMPSLSMLRQEVVILSTIKHPNLINFLGVCSEPPALVYEFLSRGSLHKYLNNTCNTMPLPWQLRTRIIGDVCVALIFLQLHKPKPIIHGYLMPEKILLDSSFTCKLCDFGLIKEGDADINTSYTAKYLAYVDPEYLDTEEMTLESDVYSFGILILHLLIGKYRLNIRKYVERAIGNDELSTIVDEAAGKWPLQHAEELAKIGVWCADAKRSKRPNLVNEVMPIIERLVKTSEEIMYDPNSLGQPFRYLGVSCSDQGLE